MSRVAKLFLLIFIMGLVGVFPSSSVFAHEENETEMLMSASEVDQKSMQSVRDFVERAKERLSGIGFGPFREELRMEGGPWKHESTYLILAVRNAAWVHGFYPEAEDRDLSSQIAEELLGPGDAGLKCVEYEDPAGVTGRYACAVATKIGRVEIPAVLIGGFHHGPLPEEPFESLLGSDYVPEVRASDVDNAETLKLFVEGAIKALEENFGLSRGEAPFTTRFRPMMRRKGGHWSHGDIYLFVMQGDRVFFNGNDQALEDTTLNITDLNGCNVRDEIMRVIAGNDRECPELGLLPSESEGFLEYLWDNPDIKGDEDKRFDDPAFEQKVSPGITPKLGYVRSHRLPGVQDEWIIGAGVYPADDMSGDGNGCAVAGSDDTRKSVLLNLLLIGFALLAAGLGKNRFRGKGRQAT